VKLTLRHPHLPNSHLLSHPLGDAWFRMFLWGELLGFWHAPYQNFLIHFFHKPGCPNKWPRNQRVFPRIKLLEHPQWRTFELLVKLKCESKSENIKEGIGVRSLVQNTLGVEGHAKTSKWGLGWVTSGSIIHMDLHKPNNKLFNV